MSQNALKMRQGKDLPSTMHARIPAPPGDYLNPQTESTKPLGAEALMDDKHLPATVDRPPADAVRAERA